MFVSKIKSWSFYFIQLGFFCLQLKESNFTKLCSTKSMLTVNGSFPGPTIRAQKGDTVYVNVYNQGTYGVTLHWYSFFFPLLLSNTFSNSPAWLSKIFNLQLHAQNEWTFFGLIVVGIFALIFLMVLGLETLMI